MAKTYQQVIEQAEQIRTETAQGANTAQRVGGTIKDAVELAHTETEEAKKEGTTHFGRTDNPHKVTKSQIGLGNVDNTSDEEKPLSKIQRTELSSLKISKQDKLVSGTNIKNLNDESIVGSGNIEVQNLIDKRLTDFRTYGRKKGAFVEVVTKAEFEEMKQFFLDLFIAEGILTEATSSAILNRSIFRNSLSLTNN